MWMLQIWIRGGAFLRHYTYPGYHRTNNAMTLAFFGDIIVVTVQYRLAILGSLHTGDDRIKGGRHKSDTISYSSLLASNTRSVNQKVFFLIRKLWSEGPADGTQVGSWEYSRLWWWPKFGYNICWKCRRTFCEQSFANARKWGLVCTRHHSGRKFEEFKNPWNNSHGKLDNRLKGL